MSVFKVFSHSRDAHDGFGNMACRGEVERTLDHRIGKTAFRLSGSACILCMYRMLFWP
jgi:hypothetical protein